jgi:GTP cyclohydrolase III
VSDRHSRFIRALEAEYEAAVAAGLGTGLSPDEAQARAFELVKGRGAEVLHRLRTAGLYPWSEEGSARA